MTGGPFPGGPVKRTLVRSLALAVLAAPPTLSAQEALPMGTLGQALLSYGEAAEFVFDARGPGFLSVVVRAEAGEDLSLTVTDEEYQALPDGVSDRDAGGDVGAEQLVVAIPGAGRYMVLVESFSGESASFRVGATFLASDVAETPPDPDGRPSAARALAPGESHDDALDPAAGDRWDWFVITADRDGVLTVLTRSEGEGDLRLELFEEGDFRMPVDVSDQDMDGVLGNESLTLNVRAGETVYFRVAPSFGGTSAAAYRVASGLIPG